MMGLSGVANVARAVTGLKASTPAWHGKDLGQINKNSALKMEFVEALKKKDETAIQIIKDANPFGESGVSDQGKLGVLKSFLSDQSVAERVMKGVMKGEIGPDVLAIFGNGALEIDSELNDGIWSKKFQSFNTVLASYPQAALVAMKFLSPEVAKTVQGDVVKALVCVGTDVARDVLFDAVAQFKDEHLPVALSVFGGLDATKKAQLATRLINSEDQGVFAHSNSQKFVAAWVDGLDSENCGEFNELLGKVVSKFAVLGNVELDEDVRELLEKSLNANKFPPSPDLEVLRALVKPKIVATNATEETEATEETNEKEETEETNATNTTGAKGEAPPEPPRTRAAVTENELEMAGILLYQNVEFNEHVQKTLVNVVAKFTNEQCKTNSRFLRKLVENFVAPGAKIGDKESLRQLLDDGKFDGIDSNLLTSLRTLLTPQQSAVGAQTVLAPAKDPNVAFTITVDTKTIPVTYRQLYCAAGFLALVAVGVVLYPSLAQAWANHFAAAAKTGAETGAGNVAEVVVNGTGAVVNGTGTAAEVVVNGTGTAAEVVVNGTGAVVNATANATANAAGTAVVVVNPNGHHIQ